MIDVKHALPAAKEGTASKKTKTTDASSVVQALQLDNLLDKELIQWVEIDKQEKRQNNKTFDKPTETPPMLRTLIMVAMGVIGEGEVDFSLATQAFKNAAFRFTVINFARQVEDFTAIAKKTAERLWILYTKCVVILQEPTQAEKFHAAVSPTLVSIITPLSKAPWALQWAHDGLAALKQRSTNGSDAAVDPECVVL